MKTDPPPKAKLPLPDMNPHPPRVPFPPGACDSHAHAFGPQKVYPYVESPVYLPPDVGQQDYEHMLHTLGCQRAVLIQAAVYGTDNSCMVAAMKSGTVQYRGIAVIDESISGEELDKLHRAGVRGVRIRILHPGLTEEEVARRVTRIASRIQPLGWHLQFLVRLAQYPWIENVIAHAPMRCALDHLGWVPAAEGVKSEGCQALLRLARLEHVWFKLIGYRSSTKLPHYPDVTPLAQGLMALASDRCVWGTDWPNTNIANMPNAGDLADALSEWLPDKTMRDRVLVDNPVRLFGFD